MTHDRTSSAEATPASVRNPAGRSDRARRDTASRLLQARASTVQRILLRRTPVRCPPAPAFRASCIFWLFTGRSINWVV
jgi:hypothetical protein